MKIKAPITYDGIVKLQEVIMEPGSRFEGVDYQNNLFGYCWLAIDYVDMMKEHGFKADFSMESLPEMIAAIAFLIMDDDKCEGDTLYERLSDVKDQLAGYLLFTLYNRYLKEGKMVRYKLSDYETGMSLLVFDPRTASFKEVDIMETLDWAFCAVEFDTPDDMFEEEGNFMFSCNAENFLKPILDQ